MSDISKIALAGLNASGARIATIADRIANASTPGVNSDLTSNLVDLAAAKTVYAANAMSVKVAAQTQKRLLDILA